MDDGEAHCSHERFNKNGTLRASCNKRLKLSRFVTRRLAAVAIATPRPIDLAPTLAGMKLGGVLDETSRVWGGWRDGACYA